MSSIGATATSYLSPIISAVNREGKFLVDYLSLSSCVKSSMKALQFFAQSIGVYSGKESKDVSATPFYQNTRGIESLIGDLPDLFNRVMKVASHLPLLLTGQESIKSVVFDGVDAGVAAISAVRGIAKKDEAREWGFITLSKPRYDALTALKMGTSALWKGYLAYGKRNTAMDPFKRARDLFIIVILIQCFVNAFFSFFRETDDAKIAEWEAEKAQTKWEGGGLSGIGRFFFHVDPVKPIKHDSIMRYFAWIEKIFCNSLARRYVGIGITVSAFTAYRNTCKAAPAA